MKEQIYGRNAVQEAIKSSSGRINKILISDTIKKDKKINDIISLAKENGVLFQFVPISKLNSLVENAPHQGVVALVSPIEYKDLDEFLLDIPEEKSLVIVLDGVEDPHNLGSIIRTAVCAGASAVIIPERRSATINSTVQKASAGAVNRIPVIKVHNINMALKKLKDHSFWVYGAEASGEENYFEVDYPTHCVIVLGGENCGITKLVGENCDYLVKIPMLSDFNSLNVANAASILIYETVRQRMNNH